MMYTCNNQYGSQWQMERKYSNTTVTRYSLLIGSRQFASATTGCKIHQKVVLCLLCVTVCYTITDPVIVCTGHHTAHMTLAQHRPLSLLNARCVLVTNSDVKANNCSIIFYIKDSTIVAMQPEFTNSLT